MVGVHPDGTGAIDVLRGVINKETVTCRQAMPVEQGAVDRRIRFQQPFFARHDDALEAIEERKALARERIDRA